MPYEHEYVTVLTDVDEKHAPPLQPVLAIHKITDDEVVLEICAVVESTHLAQYQTLASVGVNKKLLAKALGL